MGIARSKSRFSASRDPMSILLASIAFSVPWIAAAEAARPLPSRYESLDEDLQGLRADPERWAPVDGVSLARGGGTIVLEQGRIFFCNPIAGRTAAAVFIGTGRFGFAPPGRLERDHLARTLGAESLSVPIRAAVFLFGDSTEAELERSLSFAGGAVGRQLEDPIESLLRFLRDPEAKWIDPHLAMGLDAGGAPGMFYAHLLPVEGNDPLFLWIDPCSVEDVQLRWVCRDDRRTRGTLPGQDIIVQYASEGRPAESSEGDERLPFAIVEEILEVRLGDDLSFEADARLRVRSAPRTPGIFPIWLYHKLRVDTVRVDGRSVPFFQAKESPTVWIDWAKEDPAESQSVVEITYRGDLIERVAGSWFDIRSPSGWYPNCAVRGRALFDVVYHLPNQFSLASVGSRIESSTEGRRRTERFLTTRPIRNMSFQVGLFDERRIEVKGAPPIRVLMESAGGHRELKRALGEQEGIASRSNMAQQVAADLANGVRFFSSVYGPPLDTTLTATDIPGGHGIAFPGLVNLSWETFQSDVYGDQAAFRAHEAAHQWWGIGVDYRSYRDRWLSEGFAEFSGLWFMQLTLGNNEEFFRRMEESRKRIMSPRRYLVDRGQPSSPIALGDRVEMSTTRGDYQLILYEKGAWVLQMLRNMLIDLETMREDRFVNLMKEFYSTYRGESASTAEFQEIAEKHAGVDLDWFFEQWVYGNAVPRYRFAWKSTKIEGEGEQVRCRIVQEGVPAGFRMYVPIRLEFEDDRYALVRVEVQGGTTELELPLAPVRPRRVVLNPLASVLCEVREEPW